MISRFPSRLAACLLVTIGVSWLAEPAQARRRFPDIVLVTVDTLRYDRLSSSGYSRPTSPAIDALMAGGARFTDVRVVEPLTTPSLCSMLTSSYPHEHGASRNGIPMRGGLDSLPKVLGARGYRTAAFVGNWTLRDRLSGLGEHFGHFGEIFTRKRWFGLFNGEATAEDLTSEALSWVDDHLDQNQRWPFFLWVHYVEPHAPYRFHREHAEALGITSAPGQEPPASDRYDTEIAFVDRAIGDLLDGIGEVVAEDELLVVFTADHGESLGEHDYWGHGRHLYDVTLRVPLGLRWGSMLPPSTVEALASSLDLAPTVLGLIGLPAPTSFRGYDWSTALRHVGSEAKGAPAATYHQAHRGAARGNREEVARKRGLLEVGWVSDAGKEVFHVRKDRRLVFELEADPDEENSLAAPESTISTTLADWLDLVQRGLEAADALPPPTLDQESLEQLRALGYID